MPSRVRCFLLLGTDHVVVQLRRYAFDVEPACPRVVQRYPGAETVAYKVHDMTVDVDREIGTVHRDWNGDWTQRRVALDDPRWPARCDCGFEFRAEDPRQEGRTRLYKRNDTGALTTIEDAPVGAIYDAHHLHDYEGFTRHVTGMSLVLKTPAGEWHIDARSSNGPGWTRRGVPPDLVVTPSIAIGVPVRMHGWLGGPAGADPGWLVIDSP